MKIAAHRIFANKNSQNSHQKQSETR